MKTRIISCSTSLLLLLAIIGIFKATNPIEYVVCISNIMYSSVYFFLMWKRHIYGPSNGIILCSIYCNLIFLSFILSKLGITRIEINKWLFLSLIGIILIMSNALFQIRCFRKKITD